MTGRDLVANALVKVVRGKSGTRPYEACVIGERRVARLRSARRGGRPTSS